MSQSEPDALPPPTDPRWVALATQGATKPIKTLALKFMLARINQDTKKNATPVAVKAAVDELYSFFSINPRIVAEDASQLLK